MLRAQSIQFQMNAGKVNRECLVSPEISHVKSEARVHKDIHATLVDGATIWR
jgi:hypothetical protein